MTRGRVLASTTRLSASDTTTSTYDPNSNLLTLTDAEGGTTTYHYNARNLRIAEDWPGHNPAAAVGDSDYDRTELVYDAARRPLVKTDQLGDTVVFNYDLAGRLEQRDYRTYANSGDSDSDGLPDGTIADSDTFTYDPDSRLLSAASGRYTNTVTLTYDAIGRTASESLSVNFGTARTYTINHGYDADNRMIETTYPNAKVVDRTYTDRDQLDQIDYDSVMVANLDYDAGMRETFRGHGNGLFTRRVYGRDDNLVTAIVNETTSGGANRPDASFAYTYDYNKNVVSETTGTTSSAMENYSWTTSGGGGATPGYDAEDRLTYWTRSSSGSGSIHTQAWPINHAPGSATGLSFVGDWTTVDINGVTQSRTHNAVHELLTVNSTGLVHDAKGNLTRDVGDSVDRFTWDLDNRMQAADVDQDGTNDLTFTYDALGRRVSKNDAAGSVHTVFVCTGMGMGQVVCEYLANDDPSTTAPQQTYVYGSYVDEPLMKVEASSVKLYYHANRQYSVTALTDSSGAIVERYAYSPYGVTTILAPNGSTPRATSAVGNSYMYTGRRLDKEFAPTSEAALYYYRARYYLPKLGRFTSRDPGAGGGRAVGGGFLARDQYADGMNLYQYVRSAPTQFLDWEGTTTIVAPVPVPIPISIPDIGIGIGTGGLGPVGGAAGAVVLAGVATHCGLDLASQHLLNRGILGEPPWQNLIHPNYDAQALAREAERIAAAIGKTVAEVMKWQSKCMRLYWSYKDAQRQFNRKPCSQATSCGELKTAIAYKAKETALRGHYILAGCDLFNWGGKKDHPGAFAQSLRALWNCHGRWRELCGEKSPCTKNGESAD